MSASRDPGPSGVVVEWAAVPAGTQRRDTAWRLLGGIIDDPAVTLTNVCDRCGGPHGRVGVHGRDLHCSVAYAGGYAVVGVADGSEVASVGIDAEPEIDGRRDAAGLRGIVRSGVRTSPREWTRIEAVLKADGRGLRVDPEDVRLTETSDGAWSAAVAGSERAFIGWDATGPDGLVLSVAVEPLTREAARAARRGRATG